MYSSDKCLDGGGVPIEALIGRLDHLIGIHKFWGPGSYPEDQGMVWGLAPDFLCLIMILIVKHYLVKVGKWHYVRLRGSLYETPSFKGDEQEREGDETYERYVKEWNEAENASQRAVVMGKRAVKLIRNYLLRLLPIYMKQ